VKYFSWYFLCLIILLLKAVSVRMTIIAKQTQTSFTKFSKTPEKMFNNQHVLHCSEQQPEDKHYSVFLQHRLSDFVEISSS